MFKKAKWIWYDKISSPNSYGEFFGTFTAKDKAMIKISCDGDYTLFINGKYASSNQYGDFEHYKSVDEIDISNYLQKGENTLGILVWHFGKDTQRYKKYAPGVICEITQGEQIIFATDESTLCRKSKAYKCGFEREISSQLGFSYSYDATKEDLWYIGKGEDFKKAYPVDKKCNFVPRPNKRLSLGNVIKATKIRAGLYDLGREYVGLLTFSLQCKEDTQLNIAYGEVLENGRVKRKIGNRDFSIDYLAKKGENTYTNYMLRFACRYIEIDSDVDIDFIGIIPQYYPTVSRECNLTGVDKEIYEICLNTLKLSMMEHYVDCPWREQCLYAFDSRNQILSGYYAFEGGNFQYVESNLLLISKDMRSDKLLSICYPSGVNLTIPSFSLYYIIAVKEYLEHTKDLTIIEDVGQKIREILNVFLQNSKNNLICSFEKECHWNFFDWSPYLDGYIDKGNRGQCDISFSVLTTLALMAYEKICKLCTLPWEFSEKLQSLRQSTKDAFYSECEGVFLNQGHKLELINALGILAEIVTGDEAEIICQAIVNKQLISCSLSMKCFVYDALIKVNKEKYKDFILNDIRENYIPMIESGTVWETIEGASAFDNAGSLCHGWSSTPIYYYSIFNKKEQ